MCSPDTEKKPTEHKKEKKSTQGRKRKDDKRKKAEGVNNASGQFKTFLVSQFIA